MNEAQFDALAPVAYRRARAMLGNDADAWEIVAQVFRRPVPAAPRPMALLYAESTREALKLWLHQGARGAPEHDARLSALLAAHGEAGLTQAVLDAFDAAPEGHASQLELDEVAAGLAAHAHVAQCAACRARFEAVKAERERLLATSTFSQARARALVKARPWWQGLAPFWVPTIAGVVFLVVAMNTKPKAVEPPARGAKVTLEPSHARPGERVVVKVEPQGYGHVLLLSVDADRRIEPVSDSLVAPPGPLAVHAFFSPVELDPKAIVPALERSIVDYAGWPLDAQPPVPTGGAVSTARLYVAE